MSKIRTYDRAVLTVNGKELILHDVNITIEKLTQEMILQTGISPLKLIATNTRKTQTEDSDALDALRYCFRNIPTCKQIATITKSEPGFAYINITEITTPLTKMYAIPFQDYDTLTSRELMPKCALYECRLEHTTNFAKRSNWNGSRFVDKEWFDRHEQENKFGEYAFRKTGTAYLPEFHNSTWQRLHSIFKL